MPVDQAEIAQMKAIMEAMNAAPAVGLDEYPVSYDSVESSDPTFSQNDYALHSKPYSGAPPDGEAVADMQKILDRMNQITGELILEAESPVSAMIDKQAFREALVTERTDLGVRIGKWEIVVNEGVHKTFDVRGNGTTIASDLYLYDAALALSKALNKGLPINDSRVQKILALEERYAKSRNDAVVFRETRRAAVRKGDEVKANIAEDRFDESQHQLKQLQEEMLKLARLR